MTVLLPIDISCPEEAVDLHNNLHILNGQCHHILIPNFLAHKTLAGPHMSTEQAKCWHGPTIVSLF